MPAAGTVIQRGLAAADHGAKPTIHFKKLVAFKVVEKCREFQFRALRAWLISY
jgi:hypothetical protein